MANKEIQKIQFDSEKVLNSMNDQHISFRKLGRLLGYNDGGDRMLRSYIKSGLAPVGVLMDILYVLNLVPNDITIGPYIIMKCNVIVQVTDEEYEKIDLGILNERTAINLFKRGIMTW